MTSVAATAATSGHTATPQQVTYLSKVARARLQPQTVFVSSEPQLTWSRQHVESFCGAEAASCRP